MKRSALTAAAALTIVVRCGGGDHGVPEGGATIYVSFDERHGLTGGELVRMHDFDIGMVEDVALAESRVRAQISLSPEALGNLTVATTFTVEDGGGDRYLETHVLDHEAATLEDGATVDGADSYIELAALKARGVAEEIFEDVTSSDWWDEASELIGEIKDDLDEIDWTEEEEEVRERMEKTLDELEGATETSREELAERVDELTKELEELGRSDEARKLKERFQEFVDAVKEHAER